MALITLPTIFDNGLLTVGATLVSDMPVLDRERLEILPGPRGEMLDGDSLRPQIETG